MEMLIAEVGDALGESLVEIVQRAGAPALLVGQVPLPAGAEKSP